MPVLKYRPSVGAPWQVVGVTSNGFCPQIVVSTLADSTVTARMGAIEVSEVTDTNGFATIDIPKFGDWELEFMIEGVPLTQSITVDTVKLYNAGTNTSLAESTWDFIAHASESGVANKLWSVGDKKIIKVGTTDYEAQIIGFNHDIITGGGTAGITFQLVNCLSSAYKMHSDKSLAAGRSWATCNMRTSTLPTILNTMESDLTSVIKTVDKKSFATTGQNAGLSVVTTSDKLFLPSYIEIYGTDINSGYNEGTKYQYYTTNSAVKTIGAGSTAKWWTRSHCSPTNTSATYQVVYENGVATGQYVDTDSIYISPCFCV